MKAVIMLQSLPLVLYPLPSTSCSHTDEFLFIRHTPELVSKERLCDAVDIILSLQNPGGGFASYELIRGPALLEVLNPAEVFGKLLLLPYLLC